MTAVSARSNSISRPDTIKPSHRLQAAPEQTQTPTTILTPVQRPHSRISAIYPSHQPIPHNNSSPTLRATSLHPYRISPTPLHQHLPSRNNSRLIPPRPRFRGSSTATMDTGVTFSAPHRRNRNRKFLAQGSRSLWKGSTRLLVIWRVISSNKGRISVAAGAGMRSRFCNHSRRRRDRMPALGVMMMDTGIPSRVFRFRDLVSRRVRGRGRYKCCGLISGILGRSSMSGVIAGVRVRGGG